MALRAPSLSRLQFVFAVTDERPESLRVTCAARAAAAAAAACDDDADAGRGMGVQQLEVPARVATHSWRSTSLALKRLIGSICSMFSNRSCSHEITKSKRTRGLCVCVYVCRVCVCVKKSTRKKNHKELWSFFYCFFWRGFSCVCVSCVCVCVVCVVCVCVCVCVVCVCVSCVSARD